MVFFAAFLLSALPLIVVIVYVQEVKRHSTPETEPAAPVSAVLPSQSPKLAGRWQTIAPFTGFGFLVSCTAEMMTSLFPILATDYAGLSEAQAGLIFSISTVTILVAGPVFGWLADNVSHKLVLMTRGIANSLSSLLFIPGAASTRQARKGRVIGELPHQSPVITSALISGGVATVRRIALSALSDLPLPPRCMEVHLLGTSIVYTETNASYPNSTTLPSLPHVAFPFEIAAMIRHPPRQRSSSLRKA
ncbi:MAG: MFS transporter [Chloroflexota bacterium]